MSAKETSKRKKAALIMTLLVGCSGLICLIDGVLLPSYLLKSAVKVLLFFVLPLGYFALYRDEWQTVKRMFVPHKRDLLLALGLGLGVYVLIMGAYYIFREHVDFTGIVESLASGMGVTAENFGKISMYIAFLNSLLEEFFFRGFGFILLSKHAGRGFAFGFSALCFALYHLGMMNGWFSPGLLLLTVFGLFVGGCIFNYLNARCENIYPSWLVHMCANFAINTVGFMIFGLL